MVYPFLSCRVLCIHIHTRIYKHWHVSFIYARHSFGGLDRTRAVKHSAVFVQTDTGPVWSGRCLRRGRRRRLTRREFDGFNFDLGRDTLIRHPWAGGAAGRTVEPKGAVLVSRPCVGVSKSIKSQLPVRRVVKRAENKK